jgi:type I restriction enzyme R subunit
LQAFSRTNRILNTVKDHGNIVCFRNLEENTNLAIALFGNSDAHNIVILKPFKDFYDNEKEPLGYKQLVEKLIAKNITSESSFKNENEEKEFVSL